MADGDGPPPLAYDVAVPLIAPTALRTAAARRLTAAVHAGTCYFFPFFLLFLLFLATLLTPHSYSAGQRNVDQASRYH